MEGDLTNLQQEQAAAIALNFVQALGNPAMKDRDVFYAGMTAFMATTKIAQPSVEQFQAAYNRLVKLTK